MRSRLIVAIAAILAVVVACARVQPPARPQRANSVVRYLGEADRQVETRSQRHEVKRALEDMLALSGEELRARRYADHGMRAGQWTLAGLLRSISCLGPRQMSTSNLCMTTSLRLKRSRSSASNWRASRRRSKLKTTRPWVLLRELPRPSHLARNLLLSRRARDGRHEDPGWTATIVETGDGRGVVGDARTALPGSAGEPHHHVALPPRPATRRNAAKPSRPRLRIGIGRYPRQRGPGFPTRSRPKTGIAVSGRASVVGH